MRGFMDMCGLQTHKFVTASIIDRVCICARNRRFIGFVMRKSIKILKYEIDLRANAYLCVSYNNCKPTYVYILVDVSSNLWINVYKFVNAGNL